MLFPGVSTALLDALHGTYSEMLASVRGVCKVGSMHDPTPQSPYTALRCKGMAHASTPKGLEGRGISTKAKDSNPHGVVLLS